MSSEWADHTTYPEAKEGDPMPRNFGNPGSLAHIYARLHANRFAHVEQARRARAAHDNLEEATNLLRTNARSFQSLMVKERSANKELTKRLEEANERCAKASAFPTYSDILTLLVGVIIGASAIALTLTHYR